MIARWRPVSVKQFQRPVLDVRASRAPGAQPIEQLVELRFEVPEVPKGDYGGLCLPTSTARSWSLLIEGLRKPKILYLSFGTGLRAGSHSFFLVNFPPLLLTGSSLSRVC